MTTITDLVVEALKRKITVEVFLTDNGALGYEMIGFYKSGAVKLQVVDNGALSPDGNVDDYKLEAVARYNEVTEIEEWDDIVRLNHSWWQRSKERYEGWRHPRFEFIADFERLGLEI